VVAAAAAAIIVGTGDGDEAREKSDGRGVEEGGVEVVVAAELVSDVVESDGREAVGNRVSAGVVAGVEVDI
jgi:hypothetical protein